MIDLSDDTTLLAYCGWMEARGSGIAACYDVMHVVMNRVKAPGFPKSLHDVIFEPGQFSWTAPGNPEHGLEPKDDDQVWPVCLTDAPNVLGGDDDPTQGALYYANLKTMNQNGWFARNIVAHPDQHPVTLREGGHTFYR